MGVVGCHIPIAQAILSCLEALGQALALMFLMVLLQAAGLVRTRHHKVQPEIYCSTKYERKNLSTLKSSKCYLK